MRKLLLEESNQFINDRLILGEISKMLRFQTDIDYFLVISANQFRLENADLHSMDFIREMAFDSRHKYLRVGNKEHPSHK